MARRSQKERELQALHEIIDLLVPESFGTFDVQKESLISNILKVIDEGPELIGLKLRMIYKILQRCYED